jgi:hypothetical protein
VWTPGAAMRVLAAGFAAWIVPARIVPIPVRKDVSRKDLRG